MLIQMPLSVSPIIVFNTVVPCIRLMYIQPNALGLVLSSFAQSLYYVAIYITISTPAFRAPPLLLLMTIVNAHKK